jgi:hypothetical protein
MPTGRNSTMEHSPLTIRLGGIDKKQLKVIVEISIDILY